MNERACNIVGMTLAGRKKTNYSERNRPSVTVSATDPILIKLECNPGLRSQTPATNRPVLKSNLNLKRSISLD